MIAGKQGWYVLTTDPDIRDLLIKIAKDNEHPILAGLENETQFHAIVKYYNGYLQYGTNCEKWRPYWEQISLEEAIARLKIPFISPKVICGYTAEISKESIKLGCQTLSKDLIEKILDRMNPIKVDGCYLTFNNGFLIYRGESVSKEKVEEILIEMEKI